MVVLSIDCLFFVKDESPLTLAFEVLLGQKSGINAIKSNAENLTDLVQEVCEQKANVIILEDLAINPKENAIAGLLASKSDLKIIIVLRESNYIYTFKKEEIVVQSSSDLLNAIQYVSQTYDYDKQKEDK